MQADFWSICKSQRWILVAAGCCLTAPRAYCQDEELLRKWGKTYEEKVLPILQAKCYSCHSGEKIEGELDLTKFPDASSAIAAADAWERLAKRVRLNEMPPQGSPGLSDPEKGTLHRWVDSRPGADLCNQIASEETQAWYQGAVMSRRMTRFEFRRAIEDLTGYALPEDLSPPSDGAGGIGFDTVGDALFTSPIHIESYLDATEKSAEHFAKELYRSSNDPRKDSTASTDQYAFAKVTIKSFARKAWRRPIEPSQLERLERFLTFDKPHDPEAKSDDKSETQHGLEPGLSLAIQAILASPNFLFIVEEPSSDEPRGVQRISQHQFATRFALLIWSSIPDDELLDLADQGRLMEPEVIRDQLQRMLADPRARALGENFGLQWLGLTDLMRQQPDAEVFPEFNKDRLRDFQEEVVRTVSSVFREARPLTELLVSDRILVNRSLAVHYGLNDSELTAPEFQNAEHWGWLPTVQTHRGGIITSAAVLTRTSYPRRSSPVLRGRWILEEILGAKVPPPPPGVPALEDVPSEPGTELSLKERLSRHRTDAQCASCHDRMDPLGFGLENFNAIGQWRSEEFGKPIDAQGVLPSGDSFTGAEGLKDILIKRRDEFEKHAIRKLVGFAFGRDLNKFDQCVQDRALQRLRSENRADAILEEILLSYPFQHRYYPDK